MLCTIATVQLYTAIIALPLLWCLRCNIAPFWLNAGRGRCVNAGAFFYKSTSHSKVKSKAHLMNNFSVFPPYDWWLTMYKITYLTLRLLTRVKSIKSSSKLHRHPDGRVSERTSFTKLEYWHFGTSYLKRKILWTFAQCNPSNLDRGKVMLKSPWCTVRWKKSFNDILFLDSWV